MFIRLLMMASALLFLLLLPFEGVWLRPVPAERGFWKSIFSRAPAPGLEIQDDPSSFRETNSSTKTFPLKKAKRQPKRKGFNLEGRTRTIIYRLWSPPSLQSSDGNDFSNQTDETARLVFHEPWPSTNSSSSFSSKRNSRIRNRDVLRIAVFDEPDLSSDQILVDPEGFITFPLIGRVRVEGMTPGQVEHEIAHLLQKDYLVNPQVSVYFR